MSSEIRVAASDLVRSSLRPDLLLKSEYVNCLQLIQYVPSAWKNAYLESIKCLNNFVEHQPRKIGPNDFIRSFDELYFNIRDFGFTPTHFDESVLLDEDLNVINAAHRISICGALGLNLQATVGKTSEVLYSSEFLKSKGLSDATLGLSLLAKLRVEPNLECLIIHSSVGDKQKNLAEKLISENAKIYLKTERELDKDFLFYLKYINYVLYSSEEDSWCGNPQNGYAGLRAHAIKSSGMGTTSFYFLQGISQDELILLKTRIRDLIGGKNFSVHSCDSHNEVKEVAYFAYHSETIDFLSESSWDKDLLTLDKLRRVREYLDAAGFEDGTYVVGGSFALQLYSLRQARDLDVYLEKTSSELTLQVNNFKVSISKINPDNFDKSFKEIILNPASYFRFCGLNFLALPEILQMKTIRGEFPKDTLDLKMLNAYLLSKDKNKLMHNPPPVFYPLIWKFFAFYSMGRLALIQFFYRFMILRRIVYYLRKSKQHE